MKTKVLFIDDSPDVLVLCQYVLANENYEIKTADTGSRGIELASSFKPHVIFLDMVLPDLDGFEVATKIQAKVQSAYEKPVIYAFSNHNPEYLDEKIDRTTIKKCISKVGKIDHLKSILNEAISDTKELVKYK